MGERQGWLLEPTFQRAVKVVAGDDRLTSDGGAILLREADHRLGLVESLAARMHDPRRPDLIRYTLLELLRQRLYALGLGYSAQDDLDRLCHDPALKLAVWDRYGEETAVERLSSQPTQSRLIDILAHHRGNREAVRDALGDWLHRWVRATGADRRVRHGTPTSPSSSALERAAIRSPPPPQSLRGKKGELPRHATTHPTLNASPTSTHPHR